MLSLSNPDEHPIIGNYIYSESPRPEICTKTTAFFCHMKYLMSSSENLSSTGANRFWALFPFYGIADLEIGSLRVVLKLHPEFRKLNAGNG